VHLLLRAHKVNIHTPNIHNIMREHTHRKEDTIVLVDGKVLLNRTSNLLMVVEDHRLCRVVAILITTAVVLRLICMVALECKDSINININNSIRDKGDGEISLRLVKDDHLPNLAL